MRLVSVTLQDIRRFTRPVRIHGIGPGLNVFCAPNENGKSTLFDALQAVFFQPHRTQGKDIRALKPLAGGTPRVEVEIDLPQGRFRIVKQWLSRPLAEVHQGDRLIAKADDAEAWIARLTQAKDDAGPAGLLWVRQGVTALDHGSAKDLDSARAARRDLMSSVAGEVEALTGGRRMDRALARAREDLAFLVTSTGRPKTGGPLAAAEQDVLALTARQADLAALAQDLSQALSRRRTVRRDIAEIEDPDRAEDRRQRLDQAVEAQAAAQRHAGQLAQAAERVASAQLRQADAARSLAALTAARAAAATTHEQAARSARQAASLSQARTQSEAAAKGVQTRLAALRDQRLAAEVAWRAALRAEAATAAAARRGELTARLTEGLVLAESLKTLRAAAATGPDAGTLAALERLQREVEVGEALRRRSATHLSVVYTAPDLSLMLNGQPLPQGRDVPVLSRTQIDLPGLGVLTVTPGEGLEAADQLAKAGLALATALARAGCASLDLARAAAAARIDAEARLAEGEGRLRLLAPAGLPALQDKLSALPDAPAQDQPVLSASEAQQVTDALTADLATAERVYEASRAQADQDRQAEARAGVEAQAAQIAAAAAAAGLSSYGDADAAEGTLSAALRLQDQALLDAEAQHRALLAGAPDLASADAALARAKSVVTGAERELRGLVEERAHLDARIDLRSGEGVQEYLEEVSALLAAATARQAALAFEVSLLNTLVEALETARSTARDRYLQPVMTELQPLLRLLWTDAELRFDGESLLPRALVRGGQEEEIGVLSGGTQEQIALLVRLAFARLLARTGRHAPVILDDALVYTDDDRIERMFDALHAQAADLQIIVFSCRQRAFRDLGGTRLVMEDLPA